MALLLGVLGCAHGSASGPDGVLGAWKVVRAPAQGSLRAGSLVSVAQGEIAVFNDESQWARMEVEWHRSFPGSREGRLRGSGEVVELALQPEGLEVRQDGRLLAVAQPLEAAEGAAWRERLLGLPTVTRFRERLDDCIEQLETARPGSTETLDDLELDRIFNTASFFGLSAMVLELYARACVSPPEVCSEPGLRIPEPAAHCARAD
jgi:hypothetical protein